MRKGKGNFRREVRKAERAQKMPPYQISGPRSVAGRYQSCSKTGWEKCFSFENNIFFSSFLLWTILAGSLKISVWGGRKLAWKISPPKINAWWSINQLRERGFWEGLTDIPETWSIQLHLQGWGWKELLLFHPFTSSAVSFCECRIFL